MAKQSDKPVSPYVTNSGKRKKPKRNESIKKLGLSLPVSEKDVKQAYLAKARKVHPDHGGTASEFVEVQRAFEEAIEIAKRNGKRLPWIGAQLPIYIAQQATIELLEAWGGRYVVHSLDWLEDTVGEDFSVMGDRLVEIDLSGCAIGDAEMLAWNAKVEMLPFLEKLNLSKTQVGDKGIGALPRAVALNELDLRGTKVSLAVRKQIGAQLGIEQIHGTNRIGEWWLKLTS